MNSLVAICFLLGISSAYSSAIGLAGLGLVGPGAPGVLLKGPSAGGTVLGPDGGLVSGGGSAGAVLAGPKAGGIVTAGISPGIVGITAPIAAPILAPAPLISGAVLAGPSGSVVTNNGLGLGLGLGLGKGIIAGPALLKGGLGW